jgi:hypothetical protein
MGFVAVICVLATTTFAWILFTAVWDDVRERLGTSGRHPALPVKTPDRRFDSIDRCNSAIHSKDVSRGFHLFLTRAAGGRTGVRP